VFVVGGVTVGAVAVALALAADWVQGEFHQLVAKWRYASLLVTPLGFALSVYLTNRYFPNSQGSGIPQAIAARELSDQDARGRLVSIRIAVGKVLLTLLGLLCGASAGREGPTVQVGASIMFAIGRMSPRRQPGLILAGAAAGVAAAFNTPLAGIVFGAVNMFNSQDSQIDYYYPSRLPGSRRPASMTFISIWRNR
jgi:H+/Cl- antiporter ClcA